MKHNLITIAAALVATAASAQQQCPSEQEIRNMEVSASSVTIKAAERENLQRQVRLAKACRMGPEAVRAEESANQAEQNRQDMNKCTVTPGGQIFCRK